AANRLGRPLRIVGSGPLRSELQKLAGPTVVFEGSAPESRLVELYRTRRMLVFPGVEDFGIVPLEALACGMPVLAQRAGGALETLSAGRTGDFFDPEQNPAKALENLCAAWNSFNPAAYASAELRSHAEQFSELRFLNAMASRLTPLLG